MCVKELSRFSTEGSSNRFLGFFLRQVPVRFHAFLMFLCNNSENLPKYRTTSIKIQPQSIHMFEHLNFVVVLIKPWNLGRVQVNGGWCPQVSLGTRRNGIQTLKGDDIISRTARTGLVDTCVTCFSVQHISATRIAQ